MNNPIQLYVNVDSDGNIKAVDSGVNLVATEQYHYFFIVEEETANEAGLYKVVVNDMIPALVKK